MPGAGEYGLWGDTEEASAAHPPRPLQWGGQPCHVSGSCLRVRAKEPRPSSRTGLWPWQVLHTLCPGRKPVPGRRWPAAAFLWRKCTLPLTNTCPLPGSCLWVSGLSGCNADTVRSVLALSPPPQKINEVAWKTRDLLNKADSQRSRLGPSSWGRRPGRAM